MPTSKQTTAALDRCIAVARATAWGEDADVDVHHLLQCTMFTDDLFCRSRLTLRELGFYHFMEEGGDEAFTAAAADVSATPRTMTRTMEAAAVFDRIDYWTTRTGDETADTVHLLLACLEQGSVDEELAEHYKTVGITLRDVVRGAMTVRYYVSPTDRQARARGPILSPTRSDRPAAHRFENLEKKNPGPRNARSIGLRSQQIGTAELGSPVHLYLVRMHLWWHLALGAVALAQLAAVTFVTITMTWWAAIWIIAPIPRAKAPTWVRLLLIGGLTVASLILGPPWWLAFGGVLVAVLITIEGRFALLEIRADVADPAVRPRDLRRDGRINASAANWFGAMRVTGKLAAK
jgi:hypothetical protein